MTKLTPLREALSEAIRDERVAGENGVPINLDDFLKSLFDDGFIIVRNTEPSEHGFICIACGCEFGGYIK
jgi:hypothetical protein